MSNGQGVEDKALARRKLTMTHPDIQSQTYPKSGKFVRCISLTPLTVTFSLSFPPTTEALEEEQKLYNLTNMGAYYDEIEIEDMAWDEENGVFHYPCPCGDRFEISRKQLADYEDTATCPSCSLIIRVIYDPVRGPFNRSCSCFGAIDDD
jgi:diphthamide biosynthesis protein 3